MTAEEIAAGLTEAEKHVLRRSGLRLSLRKALSLPMVGLVERAEYSKWKFTPLGMQVRAIAILESNHDRA